MRRYNIVSGLLLILPFIDFALAAPVLVQEKRQAYVDVVHIPKDVITVLRKRGFDDLEKLVEDFFNTGVKPPIESSDAHASSSSAPPGPDHGSTNVVHAPGPNPASSPSLGSMQDVWGDALSDQWWYKSHDESHGQPYTPGPSESGGLDHESTGAHAPQPDPDPRPSTDSYLDWNFWVPPLSRPAYDSENQVEHVQQPNSGPLADPDFDWDHWMNSEDPPPPTRRPASPNEVGQAHKNQAEDVQQPNAGPSTDSDFDWDYWSKLEDPPPPGPASLKEVGQAHEIQAEHVQQPNAGPSTDPDFDWDYWSKLEDPPLPGPASPKEVSQAPGNQAEDVQQPNAGPSTSSDFDWNYWSKLEDPPPTRPASQKEVDQAHEIQAEHVQQPNAGPSTDSDFDWDYWSKLEDPPPSNPRLSTQLDSDPSLMVAHQPPPYPPPPTELEHEVAPPLPNLGSPETPEDEMTEDEMARQAAIYAAKGKAKVLRRISGTASSVGNAAQRELQHAERSLDPRE